MLRMIQNCWRCRSQSAHFYIKMIPLNRCLPLISIFHLPPSSQTNAAAAWIQKLRRWNILQLNVKANVSDTNGGGNNNWTSSSVGKSVREEAVEDKTSVDPGAQVKCVFTWNEKHFMHKFLNELIGIQMHICTCWHAIIHMMFFKEPYI